MPNRREIVLRQDCLPARPIIPQPLVLRLVPGELSEKPAPAVILAMIGGNSQAERREFEVWPTISLGVYAGPAVLRVALRL